MLLISCGECLSIINFTNLNSPVLINSAYWYFTEDYSFGFSPSSTILQAKCDIYDIQNNQRMCWQLNKLSKRDLNGKTGGSRIGSEIDLDGDSARVKQIYLKSSNIVVASTTNGITASKSSAVISDQQNTETNMISTTNPITTATSSANLNPFLSYSSTETNTFSQLSSITTASSSISNTDTQITVPSTLRVSTNSNPFLISQTSSSSRTTLNQFISSSVNSASQTTTLISTQASKPNTNTQITSSLGKTATTMIYVQ